MKKQKHKTKKTSKRTMKFKQGKTVVRVLPSKKKEKPATLSHRHKPPAKPEETMDRSALKAVVSQLKDMGSDIKVFKSDTDEGLQKKVNEALQKLPAPDMLKKLESIVPDKLVSVLKRDCIGLFIDLSDVSCVRCPDNGACAKQFIQNLKTGLKTIAIDKAVAEPAVEKKAAKAKIAPVTRYEADRLVFVRDVKNPNPKGDPYHDTIQRVLNDQPETLRALREIAANDFEIESDSDFMKFVTALRDPKEGVIKLDVDLSEDNKTALRKAGYDV